MNANHTPAPWYLGTDGGLCSKDGPLKVDADPANARRIVACVNACEGIENEWLEANAGMLQGHDHALERERDSLKAQVEGLMKALNDLLYGTDCYLDTENRSVFHFTTAKLAQARAALARAKS